MNRTNRRLWCDGVRGLLPNPLTKVDPAVLGADRRPSASTPPPAQEKK